MNGITIGQRATVGLGAVVVRSVEPDTVVMGNPAKPRPPAQQAGPV
jgi:acetyltransferase-like isoleucine patch superfamily enzyme